MTAGLLSALLVAAPVAARPEPTAEQLWLAATEGSAAPSLTLPLATVTSVDPGTAPALPLATVAQADQSAAPALSLAVASTKAPACKAPYQLKRRAWPLQRQLERKLDAAKLSRLVRRQQLAVAVVDLTLPGKAYYAAVNGDTMMYAASLPKIALLLSVIEQVNAGQLTWGEEYDRRLHDMITASSNPDAAWAAELVGLPAIERVLRDPRYCLYDDTFGGLWVGLAYKPRSPSHPEPLKGISHAATARQAARFFVMLERGELVSKHWSFRMLGLMSPPKHHHKFVAGLTGRSGVNFLARKSGTWRNWHSDAALIEHDEARYVAVALSEARDGEQLMRQVIQLVDDLIMDGTHRPRMRKIGGKR